MPAAAIALGSNLSSPFGDRAANLREAINRMRSLGHVQAVSSFYDTEPVGYTEQPRFLNAALLLQTDRTPTALLHELLAIERAMGRDRTTADPVGPAGAAPPVPPKGPRLIDLDLLLMEQVVLDTPALTLPHPEIPNRRFVLEPLAEIAPDLVHPTTGLTIRQLLHNLDR